MTDPLDPFTQALVFVLASLAAYRASRLVTRDTLLGSWRARWWRRFPPGGERSHPLGQLVDCGFCVGFWLSGAVFGLVWHFTPLVVPGLWWPAIAGLSGLIGKWDANT